MHLMERWATKRTRPADVAIESGEDGIDCICFKDKGSLVQLVSHKLLRTSESLLFVGRWRVLERRLDMWDQWMVRDGWFQWPVLILWRTSLALNWIVWGFHVAYIAARYGR